MILAYLALKKMQAQTVHLPKANPNTSHTLQCCSTSGQHDSIITESTVVLILAFDH